MLSLRNEKILLQFTVSLACVVPVVAGLSGIIRGADFLGGGAPDLDNHFRYLSGLLLGIGLTFLSAVPNIERHTARLRLLTIIVFIGGLGRLFGILMTEIPGKEMFFALLMELGVTPLLFLWQQRLAKRFVK